jgi:hypothetical protein
MHPIGTDLEGERYVAIDQQWHPVRRREAPEARGERANGFCPSALVAKLHCKLASRDRLTYALNDTFDVAVSVGGIGHEKNARGACSGEQGRHHRVSVAAFYGVAMSRLAVLAILGDLFMNTRPFSVLIAASLAGLGAPALVGCGSSFSTEADGGPAKEGGPTSDGTSPSDGTSSEGAGSEGGAGSDSGGTFQCADMMTSCQEVTSFCLLEADTGITSCQKISTVCAGTTDPCACTAAGLSISSMDEVCVPEEGSHSPNECQVACTRRKDAGSGSMDASLPPPPADAGKPKDAGAIFDVHIPDAHITML